MKIKLLNGTKRTGVVGQLLRHPIAVLVTSDDGVPHENEQVAITTEVSEALEFEGQQGYALLRTDAEGKAVVNVAPLKAGTFTYKVAAGTVEVEDTIEVKDLGIRQLDGVTAIPTEDGVDLIRDRTIGRPPQSRRPRIRVIG